jgi:hypothetical protein
MVAARRFIVLASRRARLSKADPSIGGAPFPEAGTACPDHRRNGTDTTAKVNAPGSARPSQATTAVSQMLFHRDRAILARAALAGNAIR